MLPFIQAMFGEVMSVAATMAIVFGIFKIIQMASALNEIKDLLGDIKRNTQDFSPSTEVPAQPRSHDDLLRALSAASDPNVVASLMADPNR